VTFADAVADRKLRVTWRVEPNDAPSDLEPRAFALVCAKHPTRPGNSQDELLDITAVEATPEGWRLRFAYVFDHDFASQYDKTESWTVVAWLGRDGRDAIETWTRGS
jgi:alpha/beta superfamily hydrolase